MPPGRADFVHVVYRGESIFLANVSTPRVPRAVDGRRPPPAGIPVRRGPARRLRSVPRLAPHLPRPVRGDVPGRVPPALPRPRSSPERLEVAVGIAVRRAVAQSAFVGEIQVRRPPLQRHFVGLLLGPLGSPPRAHCVRR